MNGWVGRFLLCGTWSGPKRQQHDLTVWSGLPQTPPQCILPHSPRRLHTHFCFSFLCQSALYEWAFNV